VLEASERRLRADLLTDLRAEPLVQEERAARDGVAPNADLGLPELCLEWPVLGVGPTRVHTLAFQALEDEVLHQVRRCERRSARVERLEDLLRVLLRLQVDDHQLETPRQHLNQRGGALGKRLGALGQPFPDSPDEEAMGAGEQRPRVLQVVVVDRRLSVHHLVERCLVLVRMPQLQPGPTTSDVKLEVVRHHLELACQGILTCLVQHRARRVHQQLEGGQALLTIDDVPGGKSSQLVVMCLHDHRTEEVRTREVRRGDPKLRDPPHVLPQREPLLDLIPDVWPLEQRDHQVLRQREYVQRGTNVRLQGTPPIVARILPTNGR